jgi:hypothetical protein
MDSGDTRTRVESAKSGLKDDEYERAMHRALAGKPFLHSDGKYLTREQIHERDRLRAEEKAAREEAPAATPKP